MADALVHIVDDEEEICRSTAFVLRLSGRACNTWLSGKEFLEGADLNASGCVILDLRMPGLDGMATLKALTERRSTLRVIMASGHADLAAGREAIAAGAADFIEKPYDEGKLIARVDELLS